MLIIFMPIVKFANFITNFIHLKLHCLEMFTEKRKCLIGDDLCIINKQTNKQLSLVSNIDWAWDLHAHAECQLCAV